MKDIYYAVAHRDQAHIDSFTTRYQDFNQELIPEIFNYSLKLKVKTWRQSDSWGSSHVIFYVTFDNHDDLVLRTNNGYGEPEVAMQMEKLVTEKVIQAGLSTNEIIFVDISRNKYPFDYQIEKVLVGRDPEKYFTGFQADYDQISFELGKYIARLSEINLEGYGRFHESEILKNNLIGSKSKFSDYIFTCLEDDLKFIAEHELIEIGQVDLIMKLFEERRALMDIKQASLVHHDLADHNITYEANHLASVFDWEACVVGDPCLDLGSCPTWKTHYPREQKMLEGYQSIRQLPDNYQEKMNIYRLRTMIWKMRFVIRMNILNADRQQKFIDALKPFKI